MSGEWIAIERGLYTKPEVVRIASAIGASIGRSPRGHITDTYCAIGALHRVWSIADEQTDDGILAGYTLKYLDILIGIPGFAAAMVKVGWLVETPEALIVPRFTDHMGQSGKKRLRDSKSKRVRRMSAPQADKPRTENGLQEQEQEEGQEEDNNNRQDTPAAPAVVAVVPLLESLGYKPGAVLEIAQHPNCTPEKIALAVRVADDIAARNTINNYLGLVRKALEGGWPLPVRSTSKSSHDAVEARRLARVAEDARARTQRIEDDAAFHRKRDADRKAFNKLTQDQQEQGFKRHLATLSPKERAACEHRPRIAFAGAIVKLMAGGDWLEADGC